MKVFFSVLLIILTLAKFMQLHIVYLGDLPPHDRGKASVISGHHSILRNVLGRFLMHFFDTASNTNYKPTIESRISSFILFRG